MSVSSSPCHPYEQTRCQRQLSARLSCEPKALGKQKTVGPLAAVLHGLRRLRIPLATVAIPCDGGLEVSDYATLTSLARHAPPQVVVVVVVVQVAAAEANPNNNRADRDYSTACFMCRSCVPHKKLLKDGPLLLLYGRTGSLPLRGTCGSENVASDALGLFFRLTLI